MNQSALRRDSRRQVHAWALALAALFCAPAAHAARCDLNGEEVNTDNGATTAGKTGILRCMRDGKLWREQELRNGQYIGLDKRYDDDGSISERQVNANGNTEGVAREYYPNKQLKRVATYENGSVVGEARGYHLDGQLASVSYTEKAGSQPAMRIEYDGDGRVRDLRCGTRAYASEDKVLCAFEGKVREVELFGNRGVKRGMLRVQQGTVLAGKGYDAQGKLSDEFEATPTGRIERRFHENGERASELVVENDFRVRESEWYMNGAPKSKTTREPVERDAKSTVEHYRDTGVLQVREQRRGNRRVEETRYDENGKPSESFTYDDKGAPRTHRKFAPDGSVVLDEEFFPDGSRKVKGLKVAEPER